MASYKTQPVIADVGSQELELLIVNYNNLLDILGTLITGLKTAANIGAVNVLATTAETALQDNVNKLASQPYRALNPKRPTY